MAHDLRPFRDYDEKDVINLFSYNATASSLESTPILKGLLVKIDLSGSIDGWDVSQEMGFMGDVGASFNNTVSERYNVKAEVVACGVAGEAVLGMLLHDIREKDENGELLKFNPRKLHEMEASLAGQAVPVVTRGIFLYEGGVNLNAPFVSLYTDSSGELSATAGAGNIVARALGKSIETATSSGVFHTLIQLDCSPASARGTIE